MAHHSFTSFQEFLNKEQDIREQIRIATKEIEQYVRDMLITLQAIHSEGGLQRIPECCEKSRALLENVRQGYDKLKVNVPKNEYYHYNDHWRYVTQQLSFLVALVVYLESERLVTREEFADIIGVKSVREEGFHVDLEDYLTGLLHLASELARLAVNSVTNGDYSRPIRISQFVAELNSGFRLLNLKNDMLRKRFDSLKYDVKKIEEVVYDLSIRGLKPVEHSGTSKEDVDESNKD
ncbi:translin [Lycorma delicatula]|uniref:translin n=1 Tax=Lycorma delicatula TaxID=130591 RepID=UPI003F5107AC